MGTSTSAKSMSRRSPWHRIVNESGSGSGVGIGVFYPRGPRAFKAKRALPAFASRAKGSITAPNTKFI
jgi:hypothetical protein